MLLLDETPNLLAAAAQQASTTTPADTAVVEGGALDVVQKTDSINHAVIDSVRNMNLGDLKAVVSGENTIFKDALSGLMDLTVAF
ncbi:MAG: hypothetical protein IJK99_02680, partial [Bacteroidales bacterium]|nr:hypothetical protein [Bacteroidales bacterium]